MLLDGGRSWLRCRALQKGSEDGGFAAEPGAQRPRGSASCAWGCSWGQRPCGQRHGGLAVWGWSSGLGLGLTKAPLPWRGLPRAGPRCGPTGTKGCRGFRALLVLLGGGVLRERVTRALCHTSVPGVPREGSAHGPSGKGAPCALSSARVGTASALASVC